MKYKMVLCSTATELEEEVNALCDKGWVPVGGVAVSNLQRKFKNVSYGYIEYESCSEYVQAMKFQRRKYEHRQDAKS